jgi:ABC-type multidrug transport system fused ATPase/permease subunit
MDSLKSSIFMLGIMTIFLAISTFTRFLSMQFLQEFLGIDMRNDSYQKFIENDLYFFEQYKSG